MGSGRKKIVIVANDAINNMDTLILWNVNKNQEIDFFDAPDDQYEILWDKFGNAYLITHDKVVLTK